MRHGAWASISCRATRSRVRCRCRWQHDCLLARRLEFERGAVHAVAHARGLGAVGEDVAEVAAAARAVDLGSLHQVGVVFARRHRSGDRLEEARPTRAALELRLRFIERLAAACAAEYARAVLVVEDTGAGTLGAVAPKHAVLLRGQPGAPFFVGLLDRKLLFGFHARHLAHASNLQRESNRSAAGSSSAGCIVFARRARSRAGPLPARKQQRMARLQVLAESRACGAGWAPLRAGCRLGPTTNSRACTQNAAKLTVQVGRRRGKKGAQFMHESEQQEAPPAYAACPFMA